MRSIRPLLVLWACSGEPEAAPAPPAAPEPAPTPTWPDPAAPLRILDAQPGATPVRLYVDAGHGAPGNLGNTNCRCEREAAFTLALQDAVLARLRGKPGVELRAGRPSAELRPYEDRIADMERWSADAVLSFHSDTRAGDGWVRQPNGCYTDSGGQGFAILYSDEGTLAANRRALARSVADHLSAAGFLPYDGADYPGLYGNEGGGVFVDRHADRERIKMLRRPKVPLVIIETHQAVNPEEVARWAEPATLDAFAAALYAAVLDVRYPGADAGPGPAP